MAVITTAHTDQNITYHLAATDEHYEHARMLFAAYAGSLSVDLSFQDFEQELLQIAQQYNAPNGGGLLLAYDGDCPIGCVGIRRLTEKIAELKRMYVTNNYRGLHIGAQLLQQAIVLAKTIGYEKLRLDTLPDMAAAQQLYLSFGFTAIPAYRFNPVVGTMYMEHELQ